MEQTARREVREETGLQVGEMALLGVFSGPELFNEYPNGDQVYNVTAAHTTRDVRGECQVDDKEGVEVRFFPLRNLPEEISPPVKPILEALLAEEGGSRSMPVPRLYTDLAWVWPFVSPPEDYAEEVETFRRRFQRHGIRDGATLLHLGSGGGSVDWHLKRHYQVTGVDLSPAMIAHAQRLNPEVEYIQGDIRGVRLEHGFDAVLLHDAAAYMTTLADLRAAYLTAAAHLRPGGVLVTPPEELRSRFQQNRTEIATHARGDRLSVEVDTHVMGLFHLDEMLAVMKEAGFEPEVSRWELSDLLLQQDYPLVTAVKRS